MGYKPFSLALVTSQHGQDTWREGIFEKLSQVKCRQRCEVRGLDDASIAHRQSLHELPCGHERGEVPRSNASDDTKRDVLLDNLLLVVIHDHLLELEVPLGGVLHGGDAALDLLLRQVCWLPLLLDKGLDEGVHVFLENLRSLGHGGLSVLHLRLGPARKGLASGTHGLIQLGLAALRGLREDFACGGIDDIEGAFALDQLAVDEHLEGGRGHDDG
mmetsp:Transcript_12659/g.27939  ORF Transcript_12659/g.27939 Transcript_12659/m.27939 type:complete len:216 (-) Transcript_12659:93-740(-)